MYLLQLLSRWIQPEEHFRIEWEFVKFEIGKWTNMKEAPFGWFRLSLEMKGKEEKEKCGERNGKISGSWNSLMFLFRHSSWKNRKEWPKRKDKCISTDESPNNSRWTIFLHKMWHKQWRGSLYSKTSRSSILSSISITIKHSEKKMSVHVSFWREKWKIESTTYVLWEEKESNIQFSPFKKQ